MKRVLIPLMVAAVVLTSCNRRLCCSTTSYDEAHFAALQEILDHPATDPKVTYSFTEASDLGLIGKLFDTPNPYHRLDTCKYGVSSTGDKMTAGEKNQCISPAGLAVLFRTSSSTISVKTQWGWRFSAVNTMPLSYSGYDLYIKDANGNWLWAASGAAKPEKAESNLVLIKDMAAGDKECLLYLPIYCEVLSCKIGVEQGATIEPMADPFRHRVVFHGSSYTHGISTSRAGMSYPMQFMRSTGIQVLPLGMSGNSKMQSYFCDAMCDVEADAYVFDTFSNPDYKMIKDRLIPFIDRLVAAHPGKPLIFQQTIRREGRNFSTAIEAKEKAKQDMASSLMHEILKNPKYKDVYFIAPKAYESDYNEYSVDGIHPDDHGYWLWEQSIEKPLLKILAKYGIK